ncbi:hypothetical protein GGX14DRAFT_312696, partial [Mycena pura]
GYLWLPVVTFADRGTKQIDVAAKDEKRAYTVMVTSSLDGDYLPMQAIHSGKTDGSLPKPTAVGMKEAKQYGFIFSAARSQKKGAYYSTIHTLKDWVNTILEPWRQQVIEEDGLPEDQKMVAYIDIYPGHTSEAFRVFVFNEHPHIILIFVPGGC